MRSGERSSVETAEALEWYLGHLRVLRPWEANKAAKQLAGPWRDDDVQQWRSRGASVFRRATLPMCFRRDRQEGEWSCKRRENRET
jgi:hypothetical protein